jgi:TRAP-type C4-dicarboxylate transport system substrate-binding protein
LVVSLDTWNRLTDQEKKWLKEAAMESAIEERELWADSEKESLEAIQAAGVQVNYPDKKPFAEKTQGILDLFKDQPEMLQLIKDIKAVE